VTGWTLGGGIEAMICPNWSIKAEYLHVDLANTPSSTTPFPRSRRP
jgi:outer membrane immunogenic protein